jgi:alpha-L-rhamnosidase
MSRLPSLLFSARTAALAALAAFACAADAAKLNVENLRVEYIKDPIGIDVANPRFSWEVTSTTPNAKQTAFRLMVTTTEPERDEGFLSLDETVWEYESPESDKSLPSNQIVYAGEPLLPFTTYYWAVRALDATGELTDTAPPVAKFITGPLTSADWKPAQWIGEPPNSPAAKIGKGYFGNIPPSPYLRKEIKLSKPVASAIIHTSARGVYYLSINGKKVGDRQLSPERTSYNKHTMFQSDDVTALLQNGDNAIGVELADGWYAGGVHINPNRGDNYGALRKFIAQLRVTYNDGTTEVFGTDASWKFLQEGPRSQVSIMGGETYTAKKEQPGWDKVGFNDTDWKNATAYPKEEVTLVAQLCEPVKIIKEIRPVSVKPVGKDAYIFDLGQNITGWCRLELPYNPGQKITIRHVEVLNEDGTIYIANLRAARPNDTYIPADEKTIVYEPRFTFHGFQYVQIEGLTQPPTLETITGKVVTSSMPETGYLETSNKDVNKLWQNIRWSQWDNQVSIPTDCPQRDEREGWMADAQVFAQNAIYNLDMAAFYTKWARDIRDDQLSNGIFPDIVPRGKSTTMIGAPGWADAGVIIPWRVYENYGDIRILEQSFDSMKSYVEYLRANNPIFLWKKQRRNDYGDWLHGGTFRETKDYPKRGAQIPKDVFATAYFYYSTSLTAATAKVLGKTADYENYTALAENIKKAFIEAYVSEDGTVRGDTQGGYAMVLHLRLIPDEMRPLAVKKLLDAIKVFDGRLSTGFHSTIWMMLQLAENGQTDEAYKLLLSRRFPSWFYSIDQGATTIWERWDGYVKGRGFQDPGMNSFNHYSLGAVGEWMYAYILGIKRDPASAGWRHYFIAPQPGGDLTWAKGSYHAITGKIEVSWKIDGTDGLFTLDAIVPANTTATVVLPFGGGKHEVGSGKHTWSVPSKKK